MISYPKISVSMRRPTIIIPINVITDANIFCFILFRDKPSDFKEYFLINIKTNKGIIKPIIVINTAHIIPHKSGPKVIVNGDIIKIIMIIPNINHPYKTVLSFISCEVSIVGGCIFC